MLDWVILNSTEVLFVWIYLNFYSILEYSWLIILWYYQVYNKVIQLYIYMYLFFLKFFSHLGC